MNSVEVDIFDREGYVLWLVINLIVKIIFLLVLDFNIRKEVSYRKE